MRKTIVAGALTALAVGVSLLYLSDFSSTDGARADQAETQGHPIALGAEWTLRDGPPALSSGMGTPANHLSQVKSVRYMPAAGPSAQQADAHPDRASTNLGPPAGTVRPFPVSSSVEKLCKTVDGCPVLHEVLAQFAREPRDEGWAANMESELRDFVAVTEAGKFTIRALECRTSLCAMEVTSMYGAFPAILPLDSPLRKSLSSGIGDFGYEIDATSAKITVSLLIFAKR